MEAGLDPPPAGRLEEGFESLNSTLLATERGDDADGEEDFLSDSTSLSEPGLLRALERADVLREVDAGAAHEGNEGADHEGELPALPEANAKTSQELRDADEQLACLSTNGLLNDLDLVGHARREGGGVVLIEPSDISGDDLLEVVLADAGALALSSPSEARLPKRPCHEDADREQTHVDENGPHRFDVGLITVVADRGSHTVSEDDGKAGKCSALPHGEENAHGNDKFVGGVGIAEEIQDRDNASFLVDSCPLWGLNILYSSRFGSFRRHRGLVNAPLIGWVGQHSLMRCCSGSESDHEEVARSKNSLAGLGKKRPRR
mmetsp:Transcript_81269/g.169826  ORF Transcript_81269/g.169826 Transcript_81269/m.169826 type:complete len:319 (-) Transcript_81269:2-958(-)